MNFFDRSRLSAVLALGLLTACNSKPIDSLVCEPTQVTSEPLSALTVNAYVDGTPSMGGYVSTTDSRYIRTVDALFNMLSQTTPVTLNGESGAKPGVQYFRLGENSAGESAQALSGSQHTQAKDPGFYNGGSFPALQVSQIEAAITSAASDTLSVVVTDLYQKEQYVTEVVDTIEDTLAEIPQGAVGIMGIRSEFNGIVYTEAQRGASQFEYNLTSEPSHPFYILLIGRVDEVSFYMNELERRLGDLNIQGGVQSELFSPERIYRTAPVFERKVKADFEGDVRSQIKIPASRMKGNPFTVKVSDPSLQPLGVDKRGDRVELPFAASLELMDNIFPNDFAVSFSQSHQSFDSETDQFVENKYPNLDAAVGAVGAKLNSDRLDFILTVDPKSIRPANVHFFTLNAVVQPPSQLSSSFLVPWRDWSSDSADSATNQDGSRTHNLDDFLEGMANLTLSKMRESNIPLGQYCFVVEAS